MEAKVLQLLKLQLKIQHNSLDEVLKVVVNSAIEYLNRAGVKVVDDNESNEVLLLVVDLAEFQYRNKNDDVKLPNHIRYRINNLCSDLWG